MGYVDVSRIGRRVGAVIASGALAASTMGAPAAFAVEASAGDQTGTGSTDVTVQLASGADERGGTEHNTVGDPAYNPDEDGDGLGDNIAFTVPAAINFVSDSQGRLTGPSAEATYIENESVFAIHASSMQVESQNGWNIVADASASGKANSIDFQVGPAADMLDAAAHLSKADVGKPSAWNMKSKQTGQGVTTDRVQMKTAGDISHVNQEIKSQTKVAKMHWYVTPGTATS